MKLWVGPPFAHALKGNPPIKIELTMVFPRARGYCPSSRMAASGERKGGGDLLPKEQVTEV